MYNHVQNYNDVPTFTGARGGAVGWITALQAEKSRVRLPMLSLEIIIDITLPTALLPWSRLILYQQWVTGTS
jgi:hypothetical protein